MAADIVEHDIDNVNVINLKVDCFLSEIKHVATVKEEADCSHAIDLVIVNRFASDESLHNLAVHNFNLDSAKWLEFCSCHRLNQLPYVSSRVPYIYNLILEREH